MREILFRGKKKHSREWVEGLLWKKKYKSDTLYISCFPDKDDHEEAYVIDPETVCQYTGLTDKNGKKIFEGDIVEATVLQNLGEKTRQYTEVYNIKYHPKHCYFYLARERNNLLFDGNWSYAVKGIDVIGNIFDNPEY